MEKIINNKKENIIIFIMIFLVWITYIFGLAYLAWINTYD
jgi:hypothetical protein